MESSSVWKPNVELSPNCPRCGSSNTKFCYYNNYSLTQPRYFCKGCRRYWTKGGSLRNVPVGGGCRKNRRSNKNLRQSIHEGLNFKNSTTNNSIGQTRTSSSPSSPSSVVADGPNIDLALVYANFLNQKPNSGDGVIENKNSDQLQQVFDLSNIEGGGPSTNLLHEEFGLVANNQMYLSGFNSMEMHQEGIIGIEQCSSSHHDNNDGINFELPPLPGDHEDQAATHDDHLMWSNNPHEFQATHQPPFFGPNEPHDDADLLIGNWSPFDLPRDSSFSRP